MLITGDAAEKLKDIQDNSIDLVVTSPPYDNLRTYNGYSFVFEKIAVELVRVIKTGGIIVWIVGDASVNGSETGTSFRQALFFKELGLRLHDTMIYKKSDSQPFSHNRYEQSFEYMFVLSKGRPKTFNGIKDKANKWAGSKMHGTVRDIHGKSAPIHGHNKKLVGEFGLRHNVWEVVPVKSFKSEHPAIFPLKLAKDHVISWSNEGDTVLDPLMGSGSTGVAALELNRKFIGIEISPEYVEIAKKRMNHERHNCTSPDCNTSTRGQFDIGRHGRDFCQHAGFGNPKTKET